jgi:hypothetical protein
MSDTVDDKREVLGAGAIVCPICCVEYIEVEFEFEFDGIILRNVKALKCPICQEEIFTPAQYDAIQDQLRSSTPK